MADTRAVLWNHSSLVLQEEGIMGWVQQKPPPPSTEMHKHISLCAPADVGLEQLH